MSNTTLLRVTNISKSFGPTRALESVDLQIKKGEIHSLIGKNGAGKSTLVNIISGLYKLDSGNVIFEGENINKLSIYERQRIGIRMVTQHASVVPQMTVAENISIGLWPKKKSGLVDWRKLNKEAGEVLQSYGIDVDPLAYMSRLDPVLQRKINIVRALFGGGKLIILDEPTTSLSSGDRDNLFEFVKELSQKGIAFMFISHYLDEILRISPDPKNISVIRDGRIIKPEISKEELNETYLANLLAGEEVILTKRVKPEARLLNQVNVKCSGFGAKHLSCVDLSISKGEVVGIVGFPQSGAREFLRALYGLEKKTLGTVTIEGTEVNIKTPDDALANGIVYVSHDRHSEGISQMHSIRENITVPVMKRRLSNKLGIISKSKEQALAEEMAQFLNVKMNSVADALKSLSGGNQQKVVVAKALACEPKCLLLDEPTIGIDIKSREEILEIVNQMTQQGMSVFYLTNDFEELVRISDRLIFFENGFIKDIRENTGFTATDIVDIRDFKKEEAINEQKISCC